ncbi:MAG: hypothetical protein ACYCSF_02930 [Acidimicrobiales bacterium]
MPAAMVLLLIGMQFALYGLASHAASLVVAEGGAVARSSGGSLAAASRLLNQETASLGAGLLTDPHVEAYEAPNSMMVLEMTAGVPSIIPGIHLSVRAKSEGPAQQFRPTG